MHILFTDTHPRKIAEATRTKHLQPAMDELILTLVIAARSFDSRAEIPRQPDDDVPDWINTLADWAALSQSNWRFLSNVLSMLLFEVTYRTELKVGAGDEDRKHSILTGKHTFQDYRDALNWSGISLPVNLPENGLFDVPYLEDPKYLRATTTAINAYRLVHVDHNLTDDDLKSRDIPNWYVLSLTQLVSWRRRKVEKLIPSPDPEP